MTKKHFEAIAKIISEHGPVPGADDFGNQCYERARRAITWDLADYFHQANPRFDRLRFLRACNVGVNYVRISNGICIVDEPPALPGR